VRGGHPNRHIRRVLDGKKHSPEFRVLAIEFTMQLPQSLPQIPVSLLFADLLEFVRDVEQTVIVIIDTDSVVQFPLLVPHYL